MKKKNIKEYGGKETYKSKSAMMKHEKSESKSMEKKEKMHRMPNGKMMKGAKHKGKK